MPTEYDPNDGTVAGAAFIPTDLDPHNQTRSDARRAYYDPYASRPNLHVMTGRQVTRILIEGYNRNSVTDLPSTGGNLSGDGSQTLKSGDGLFGQGSTKPPSANDTRPGTGKRYVARDLPQGLRITGVEVSKNSYPVYEDLY